MKQLIKKIKDFLQQQSYEKEMMTLARSEFSRDWQYAYYMLLQGKYPSQGETK